MSFDKAIESGKEHRKQFKGAKFVSYSCRNHGECPWCRSNRLYGNKRREIRSLMEIRDFLS